MTSSGGGGVTRFVDKVALVTGASSGVGREVAHALGAEGAAVAAVGRDRDALAQTVASVEEGGGRAIAITGDVRLGADCERAVAETRSAFGGVDLLVNSAGVFRTGTVPEMAEGDFDVLFDTHAKACFLMAKFAIPAMRARGSGAIVNVSSVFALAGDRGSAAYAASKAAVVALSQTMALDHIGEGIRVNCVAPGSMRTTMTETVAQQVAPGNADVFFDHVGRLHPVGRMISPVEVAKLVVYLLSDDAAAVVGSCYTIDGGRLAQLGTWA